MKRYGITLNNTDTDFLRWDEARMRRIARTPVDRLGTWAQAVQPDPFLGEAEPAPF